MLSSRTAYASTVNGQAVRVVRTASRSVVLRYASAAVKNTVAPETFRRI